MAVFGVCALARHIRTEPVASDVLPTLHQETNYTLVYGMVWSCTSLVSAISKASSSMQTALPWSPPFSSACMREVCIHKTKHEIRGMVIIAVLKYRKLTEASSFRRGTRPWCFAPYAALDCSTACVHYICLASHKCTVHIIHTLVNQSLAKP